MDTTIYVAHLRALIALDSGSMNTAATVPLPCRTPEEINEMVSFLAYHEIVTDIYMSHHRYDLHQTHAHYQQLNERLRPTYYAAIARQLTCATLFKDINRILGIADIPVLPLKGMSHYLAAGTSQPRVRLMRDLDILVRPEDVEKAEAALVQNGYSTVTPASEREYWRTQQMHLKFRSNNAAHPVTIELHWALDYQRNYPVLPQLWGRTHSATIDGALVRLLSFEDTLFVLALHARRFGKPLILKYVYDVIEIFRTHGDQLDIAYLISEAKRSRIRASLCLLLQQTMQYYSHATLETAISELAISPLKQRHLFPMLIRRSLRPQKNGACKPLFAAIHAVAFDTWQEPALYMLNIPFKQFCDYFDLPKETWRARLAFSTRLGWYGVYGIVLIVSSVIRFIAARIGRTSS